MEDAETARDPLGVEPLEAAARHPRRHAVANQAGRAEMQRSRAREERVRRRHEKGRAVDEIARVEVERGEEMRPVDGQLLDESLPLAAEPRGDGRSYAHRVGLGADRFEPPADTFPVEPLEHAAHDGRRGPDAGRAEREAERPAAPAGRGGPQEECRPLDLRLVVQRQRERARPDSARPGREQVRPLLGESHGRDASLSPIVAIAQQRGQEVSRETLVECLREMLLIRRFEEAVEERFRAGELPGFLHVAIGQEAVAVGVCRALEPDDVIASTHRAHGHTLAKGTHPNELMAELYGKVEGCSRGYGGSMHLYDVERGNLGANAVVGGGLPAIVGSALAFKLRREPRVAVAFFGDGATNIGTFHESLNLAQLWGVPAVFVCENNHYAESTPAHQQLPIEDLSKRAEAYGMTAMTVDGQDVEAVYRTASEAAAHAREGRGPVFLLAETYRLTGHYVGDPQVYRPREEVRELRKSQDPVEKLHAALDLPNEEWAAMEREVTKLVEGSIEFAKNGTDPAPEDALKNVYA